MSDRYTVHPHPGIVGGVYLRDNDEMSESGPLTPAEARRLAHALLDAIGERDEAAAIVRDLADADPVRLRLVVATLDEIRDEVLHGGPVMRTPNEVLDLIDRATAHLEDTHG